MNRTGDQARASNKQPEIIFHYTTLSGLIGILGGNEIQLWASHIRFMNDREEFRYAVERLPEFIEAANLDKSKEWQRPGLQAASEWFRSGAVESVQVYACSFCSDSDLLSQWRGYGINGGYSLGFETETTSRSAFENDEYLYPVTYGTQAAEATDIIVATLDAIASGISPPELNWALALIKHPMFSEEHEWRWVCQADESGTERSRHDHSRALDYRAGILGPVPYVTFEPREKHCARSSLDLASTRKSEKREFATF